MREVAAATNKDYAGTKATLRRDIGKLLILNFSGVDRECIYV